MGISSNPHRFAALEIASQNSFMWFTFAWRDQTIQNSRIPVSSKWKSSRSPHITDDFRSLFAGRSLSTSLEPGKPVIGVMPRRASSPKNLTLCAFNLASFCVPLSRIACNSRMIAPREAFKRLAGNQHAGSEPPHMNLPPRNGRADGFFAEIEHPRRIRDAKQNLAGHRAAIMFFVAHRSGLTSPRALSQAP